MPQSSGDARSSTLRSLAISRIQANPETRTAIRHTPRKTAGRSHARDEKRNQNAREVEKRQYMTEHLGPDGSFKVYSSFRCQQYRCQAQFLNRDVHKLRYQPSVGYKRHFQHQVLLLACSVTSVSFAQHPSKTYSFDRSFTLALTKSIAYIVHERVRVARLSVRDKIRLSG